MAREITNRADLKRRRELMRVAIEKRAAERLAASQRLASIAPPAVVVPRSTAAAAASPMAAAGATPVVCVRPGTACQVDGWLRANAAEHKRRFVEVARNKRGQRVWNVDCDACGTQLTVQSARHLEDHATSANHIASGGNVDGWLLQHAAEHKMRFVEVARNKRGQRVWNVDCGTCGTQLSVARVKDLRVHFTSARHIAGGTHPAIHAPYTGIAGWLQALSTGSSIALTRGRTQRKRPRA
jgi:hypothetical protein